MEFERALGRGPDGPTYDPAPARRPTLVGRVRAWCWYRFGWGQRPRPQRD